MVASDAHNTLSRDVYCLLGVPIDICDLTLAARTLRAACSAKARFLFCTPNVNFLIAAHSDPAFRSSLLAADLSTVDGMPLVWIGRTLGIAFRERVSGSDLFDLLSRPASKRISVCIFGGAPGAANAACSRINQKPETGVRCVGAIDPGHGSVEQMSSEDLLRDVNSSGADFLLVALGARKGQEWLIRNHARIQIPVRAHLGAVVNFHAGTIRRAPAGWRRIGFEWLWRIKEEPALWRRYWSDGVGLFRLMFANVIPLAIMGRLDRRRTRINPQPLELVALRDREGFLLQGDAIAASVPSAEAAFLAAFGRGPGDVHLEMSSTRFIDLRFMGLLLMLKKVLEARGDRLVIDAPSRKVKRRIRLNVAHYLLD